MALPDGLLDDLKNYLDITWSDTQTDKKVAGIASRGITYIDRIAGSAQDYTIEGSVRTLLFSYAAYDRAGALDEFRENYGPMLKEVQLDKEGEQYAATSSQTDPDV